MANIFDVAAYILDNKGEMTAMKLQKLCYYSQAWNLVWDERPLFHNLIRAWRYGPVCSDLYSYHAGNLIVSREFIPDSLFEANLTKDEQETIDAVIKGYGAYTAQQLSDLTHAETPWREAIESNRQGGSDVISTVSMHDYYSNFRTE